MGSFVLFIHDFSDHWLELAKLAIYAKYEVTDRGLYFPAPPPPPMGYQGGSAILSLHHKPFIEVK